MWHLLALLNLTVGHLWSASYLAERGCDIEARP